MTVARRRPVGAELIGDGVDFRVWAPDRKSVSVVIEGSELPLERESDGHFRGFVAHARAGTLYRFRLDREKETYPDPASRFQPEGPHAASMVVDPAYPWRQQKWREMDPKALVIYEMHIGTFTRQGTWRAAIDELRPLADIGINLLEIMPVNEFAGRFGWGYYGVDLWAPSHLYGTPDDFRLFVDSAHAFGIGVILDVVYNHFGPDGCYWKNFAKDYFTDRYENEWGEAINFDAPGVRELIAENAGYWIEEFHLDGLRLDATQSINDRCHEHIIATIQRRAREEARDRSIIIIAENEPQDVALIKSYGVDAMWNDDWHHSAMVAATGQREAYYTDYRGEPQEFVSMAKHGFLYQGQWYSWQKHPRGTWSRDVGHEKFVCFLQNHDQIANSTGERIQFRTTPGRVRALTALLLLGPNTPMLFQGQEFAASTPFLYFADHKPDLARAVENGRKEFMTQFPSIALDQLPTPNDPSTFERCKLDHSEREKHADAVALHRELLHLRRPIDRVDGAVLGERALLLRFDDDRLLLVNLGPAFELDIMPEPLLAPLQGHQWEVRWSSEPVLLWRIPAEAAVLLEAVRYTRS